MPSRKRSKGQARAAKTDAKNFGLPCRHGMRPVTQEQADLCKGFLATHIDQAQNAFRANPSSYIWPAILSTYRMHPDVWKDDNKKKLLTQYLAALGTKMVIEGKEDTLLTAGLYAFNIILLERYDASINHNEVDLFNIFNDSDFFMKYRDLVQGCERSVTRFFIRRIEESIAYV